MSSTIPCKCYPVAQTCVVLQNSTSHYKVSVTATALLCTTKYYKIAAIQGEGWVSFFVAGALVRFFLAKKYLVKFKGQCNSSVTFCRRPSSWCSISPNKRNIWLAAESKDEQVNLSYWNSLLRLLIECVDISNVIYIFRIKKQGKTSWDAQAIFADATICKDVNLNELWSYCTLSCRNCNYFYWIVTLLALN